MFSLKIVKRNIYDCYGGKKELYWRENFNKSKTNSADEKFKIIREEFRTTLTFDFITFLNIIPPVSLVE